MALNMLQRGRPMRNLIEYKKIRYLDYYYIAI